MLLAFESVLSVQREDRIRMRNERWAERVNDLRTHPAFAPSRRWIGSVGRDSLDRSLLESQFGTAVRSSDKPKRPMASRLIERGLRVRILTGFTAVIVLTLAIAGWSYYHISTLSSSAEHLFIENYRTISYMHQIELSIDGMMLDPSAFASLDENVRHNLDHEFTNITEPGERNAADAVRVAYERFSKAPTAANAGDVKQAAENVQKLNERAMLRRSVSFREQGEFARTSTVIITLLLLSLSVLLAVAVSRRSLREFRELDRAKSNFVATAAHELKNPLSAIKTTSGLIADGLAGPLTPKQSDLIASISGETNRLLNLVRELLDLARLEAGTLQLQVRPVDIEVLIESAILPVAMKAEEADVAIDIVADRDLPDLPVDPNKLAWAVTNVLANAVRYSPKHSSVTVNARRIDNEIWISVSDLGKGIAADDLTRIFDKFVQVEEGAMGGGSGSGLGLSIAREIVLAHGGRIWATSDVGHGSTFTIALPIESQV